jgi:hypothetical protein
MVLSSQVNCASRVYRNRPAPTVVVHGNLLAGKAGVRAEQSSYGPGWQVLLCRRLRKCCRKLPFLGDELRSRKMGFARGHPSMGAGLGV